MAIEPWSDAVVIARLSDEPHLSDDLAALESAADDRDAVLDFSGVRFVNSTNLAALLRVRKRVLSADRQLVLCNVGTPVWGVFLTTGLDHVFQCSPDVPTALARIQVK